MDIGPPYHTSMLEGTLRASLGLRTIKSLSLAVKNYEGNKIVRIGSGTLSCAGYKLQVKEG